MKIRNQKNEQLLSQFKVEELEKRYEMGWSPDVRLGYRGNIITKDVKGGVGIVWETGN